MKEMEIKELIEESEADKLVLPNFQRIFEWERNSQNQLLASIFFNIPVGSILTLIGERDYFATKRLCFSDGITNTRENCSYLLDGQQRISSLKSIFFDFFNDLATWKTTYEDLYPKLRNRWFVKVKPDNGSDLFGWQNLIFEGLKKFEPKEIIPLLVYKQIYKNKTTDWFHPEYYTKDENGEIVRENKRSNEIAKKASEEWLVPLYTIYDSVLSGNSGLSLHQKVLNKIADERLDILKAEVDDGTTNIYSLLGHIEEDIVEMYKNDSKSDEVMNAWSSLRNNWVVNVSTYINGLIEVKIPVIELPQEDMSRAIYAFEYINRGGTNLSNYDLIVAKAAKDRTLPSLTDRIKELINTDIVIEFPLTDNLADVTEDQWNFSNMDAISSKDGDIISVFKNQYLDLLSIFSFTNYGDISDIKIDLIKKEKILSLEYQAINNNTPLTVKSLIRAYAFLQFRCGIIKLNNLNYDLMILPIAYMLSDDDIWSNKSSLAKIEYWYWSSLFSGAYRERQNEQCILDIKLLYSWIDSGNNDFKDRENRVLKADEYSDLNTLIFNNMNKNIPKAIDNGILQYILSKQPHDFLNIERTLSAWNIAKGMEYEYNGKKDQLTIEDHHICPLSSATDIGKSSKELRSKKDHILNSPLNRTLISSTANRLISDKKPIEYFEFVDNKLTLYGHCIPTSFKDKFEKNPNESDDEYFNRIAKERYFELQRDLTQELVILERA